MLMENGRWVLRETAMPPRVWKGESDGKLFLSYARALTTAVITVRILRIRKFGG
jgi:hypothetical protein